MAKRTPLDAAQNLMERKQNIAAQAFAQAQKRLLDEQDQLQQLLQYKKDYQQIMQNNGAQGMRAQSLAEFQEFIVRLDQSIEQQKQHIQQFKIQSELKRKEWQMTYQKAKAVDNLQHRLRQQTIKQQNKLEQKQSDEQASKTLRKRSIEKP